MKFNEPVRPAGIGRKQVAFDTGRKPSALTLIESADNTQLDPQSNEAQNVATLAQAGAQARAIAYSAASSAVANNYPEIWGARGVQDFTIVKFPSLTSGEGAVKWYSEGTLYDSGFTINNPAMYISTEDNSKIYTNKPGWWLVDAMVSLTNYKNSQNYKLFARVGNNPDFAIVGYDTLHTNQYPTLRINAQLALPITYKLSYEDEPRVTDPYFQIIFYAADGIGSDTTVSAEGFIHATYLRPYEQEELHPLF